MWPDGIYAIAKTLQALEKDGRKISEILNGIQKYPMQRIKVHCHDDKKKKVMEKINSPPNCEVIKKDGILMKTKDSQILIRPSGTEDYIRINIETKDEKSLDEKSKFWKQHIEKLISTQ